MRFFQYFGIDVLINFYFLLACNCLFFFQSHDNHYSTVETSSLQQNGISQNSIIMSQAMGLPQQQPPGYFHPHQIDLNNMNSSRRLPAQMTNHHHHQPTNDKIPEIIFTGMLHQFNNSCQ